MNLILLGAPGAGKGTQAEKISLQYGLPHISTGEILRRNVREQTPLGIKIAAFPKGTLIPDEIMIDLIKQKLSDDECAEGCLLDGFPRTIAQAIALDAAIKVDGAIVIDTDEPSLIKRITGRRVCRSCGKTYHVDLHDVEKCVCGGELLIRDDDNEETVIKRLSVYHEQTAPLIRYYGEQGKLFEVDGNGTVDEVFERMKKVLDGFGKK